MMTGSSETSLCGDANMPNNYWLQGGMVFNSMGVGDGRIAWADTASGTGTAGCVAQTSTVSYTDTCPYRVDVFTAQSENAWKVTIVKLSPCTLASQTVTTAGMSQYTINANSIPRTSVWFEDITHSPNEPSGSTWDSQFSGSPTAQSWYNPTTSFTWTAFTAENQQVHQCATPQITTDTGPNEVITGSLANAGTATWNLQRLADNYTSNC